MAVPPPDSYKPGTKLVVGSHEIEIIKYISKGGFALVYTCYISPPFNNSNIACLKRVQVPSKWQLSLLRQEVDAMRRLRGNKHIVSYIDSHAARLNSGRESSQQQNHHHQQYEVFLLMEYCENNGLIDLMNARLVHKLTEPEILQIMYQITIGVAMCHHLQPPLIHRDIKIENVLIDKFNTYKLADFGSSVPYIQFPTTQSGLTKLKEDIMQHTTPQYRAPEMIDLSKGFPIDDKSDIWALGIFLYKVCYYITPFESGSMAEMEHAILNSSQYLRFKDQPGSMFSPRLKNVIKCCLREDPRRRPNAVQLLQELVNMMNLPLPSVIPYSVQIDLKEKFKDSYTHSTPDLSLRPAKSNKSDPFELEQISSNKSIKSIQSNLSTKSNSSNLSNVANNSEAADPFSSIDKSKLLRKNNHLYSLNSMGSKSTTSLKDYVQKQVEKSEELMVRHSRKSEDRDLDFLRNKQEKTDTGGSIKSSLQRHLRKISTGGSSIHSVSANNTGTNKRSSISSIKQLLTGGKKNGNSNTNDYTSKTSSLENRKSNEFARESRKPSDSARLPTKDEDKSNGSSKRNSIASRMQFLLKNSETNVTKTAHGYGKFTDTEDINSINQEISKDTLKIPKPRSQLTAPKIPTSLSSKSINQSPSNLNSTQKYSSQKSPVETKSKSLPKQLPTSLSIKPTKKAPPKPTKPGYLKSLTRVLQERKLSNTSDVSLPDLDDLEKQFSKRFPSYV